MDAIPDSAAINEAVKLAKKKKFQGLSGFVNGVLRKIAKEKENIVFPDKDKDLVKYLSVKYSAPEWLCSHFISECGADTAEKILYNSLCERPVIIRTNISRIKPSDLKTKLGEEGVTVSDTNIDGAYIIDDFDGVLSLEAFEDGLFSVQDLSSQEVFNSPDVIDVIKRAELVVDVCAAPGGKTCHVADLLKYYQNESCKVISRDLTDSKVDRIYENVERLELDNVTAEVHDALEFDKEIEGKADLVIADLPCSGLGVIGRKVDIKYRVEKEDLDELSALQKEILKVVSRYVKPGGMMIYSTCTVNRKENADNADWIAENLPFEPVNKPVQILNDEITHDGFYISRWIKKI